LTTADPSRDDPTSRAAGDTRRTKGPLWLVCSVAPLGAALFAWVRATNFRGYDEWVIFSLLSRGILSFPYANRPLNLLWTWPGWFLAPDRLWGIALVHAFWLTLAGVLTGLLVRRLLPGSASLAFLAACFTVVWAPSDLTRLSGVQMSLYSGSTAGTLTALWLLVEAWCRRCPALLSLAAAAAVATVLSVEAALPLLALGPLLLVLAGARHERGRWLRWSIGWYVLLAALGWRAVAAIARAGDTVAYQTEVLGFAPAGRVPSRLLSQFRHHLLPLFVLAPRELAVAAVPLVLVVFGVGCFLAIRRDASTIAGGRARRRALALAGLVGIVGAALAYLPFVVSQGVRGPVRTQFLSAPGMGLAIAASVSLLASALPVRLRPVAIGLLGAWVVAVGAGRTVALQAAWDKQSAYGAQRRLLLQLASLAPDVQPHTFFVLLQREPTFAFDFTFTHAVAYLYEGRARGHASDASRLLYETWYDADAVVWQPQPILRAWGDELTRYRYDELFVCREQADGRLALDESWPAELPALPSGARYAPKGRIRAGAPSRRLSLLAVEP